MRAKFRGLPTCRDAGGHSKRGPATGPDANSCAVCVGRPMSMAARSFWRRRVRQRREGPAFAAPSIDVFFPTGQRRPIEPISKFPFTTGLPEPIDLPRCEQPRLVLLDPIAADHSARQQRRIAPPMGFRTANAPGRPLRSVLTPTCGRNRHRPGPKVDRMVLSPTSGATSLWPSSIGSDMESPTRPRGEDLTAAAIFEIA